MSHFPVELVREIVEFSAQSAMVSDARWVGQSLSIASRAVYAWVAPILFESLYITPAKFDLFNELASSGKLPGVAYTRTFIADDRDHPIWRTSTRRTFEFLASLDCSKLQVVAGADAIFEELCEIPQFRPRVVHLTLCKMTYLPLPHATLQSVFSHITHMSAETISSFECDFDMAAFFPEVTHIIIEVFFGSFTVMGTLKRLLAELPKLQRVLVGTWPFPRDHVLPIIQTLATLRDKRVYHGWNLERVTSIDLDDPPALRPKSLARLARDGHDIWMEGEPVLPDASG